MTQSLKKSWILMAAAAAIAAWSTLAQAQGGSNGGNGGDALVCFNDVTVMKRVVKTLLENQNREASLQEDPFDAETLAAIKSVRLLDLYEAAIPRMDGVEWKPIALDLKKNEFTLAYERLRALGNQLYFYSAGLEHRMGSTMPSRNFRLVEGGVVAVPDSDHSFIPPSGCAVIQIALQYELNGQTVHGYYPQEFDSIGTQVLIDSRLYARLSKFDRVALITHEILYNFHRSLGEGKSVQSRRVNALLYQDGFESLDFTREYREMGYDILFNSLSFADTRLKLATWSEMWTAFRGRDNWVSAWQYGAYDHITSPDTRFELHDILAYKVEFKDGKIVKWTPAGTVSVTAEGTLLFAHGLVDPHYRELREAPGTSYHSFATTGKSRIHVQFSDNGYDTHLHNIVFDVGADSVLPGAGMKFLEIRVQK